MLNVEHILQTGGLLAVGLIVFAESGLLLGFFLPGDTLLFSAGIFASQNKLPIEWLLPIIIIAAIVGYQVGYKIGQKAGPRFFKQKEGLFFNREYVDRTEKFFEVHGGKSVVFARFIAVVRTFVSVIAGVANMDRRKFFIYNVIGALLWGLSVTMAGYWLGSAIPDIDKIILPLVGLALLLTVAFPVGHLLWQKHKINKKNTETEQKQ